MANLKRKQKKLDANKDGKISGEDFSLLRERKALGGLASKLANRMRNFFDNPTQEKSVKDLVEEYNKLTPEQKDKKFNTKDPETGEWNVTLIDEKDFDMFMINDVMLNNKELSYVKSYYPDFKGDTPADVYRHTNSEQFVQDMYENTNKIEQREGELFLREQKAEGGTMDDQMNALAISVAPAKVEAREVEEPMLPDEEMEEDYVDYVVEETLSTEDKTYLNAALEKDAKLSEIFDQVVESATEFTGSGTVEGPGTGRSDSIPARLSDGEFVFTAKATEEIGSDNLMSMMKEAEAAADRRQDMANGGPVEEEDTVYKPQPEPQQQDIRVTKETVGGQAGLREEEDLVSDELKKSMLSTRPYVRS
tara:strand:+ start:511 stop:1602 length:1092 start_codon:yes stop_codon:yes gene_type:complete